MHTFSSCNLCIEVTLSQFSQIFLEQFSFLAWKQLKILSFVQLKILILSECMFYRHRFFFYCISSVGVKETAFISSALQACVQCFLYFAMLQSQRVFGIVLLDQHKSFCKSKKCGMLLMSTVC